MIQKTFFRLITLVLLITHSEFVMAAAPPDSTTSIVDKSAAIYIVEEGRTLFNEGKVRDALIKFRQASVKDPNSWKAVFWVGKCHYAMNNYGLALKYADQAIKLNQDEDPAEVYFLLGTSYHRVGNIDSALIHYQSAKSVMNPIRANTLWLDHHIKECEYAKSVANADKKHARVRVPGDLNSGYDEYGVVYSDSANTLYFTGRRSNTTGGRMNPDDQSYFEDVYSISYNTEEKKWENATNDLGKINSEGFDALNFLAPDRSYAIMTLNTTATETKKTTKGSDICEIKPNTKGGWNSPKAISNKSINTSYFEGSATLTADGNTMYFVSDRKGDKSATDIYVVRKNGRSWGDAEPLPMNVNTVGRETTPFITPDGKYLFYSSDGLVGLGGYDVYVTKNTGEGWSDPVNLGPSINTFNNDTHFTYIPQLKKAFISGFEIIGEKASIDIYEIAIESIEALVK